MISAATGEGVDDLLAATADRLPHPEVELTALVPYDRGDLIDRAHREAEILDVDHLPEGTRLPLPRGPPPPPPRLRLPGSRPRPPRARPGGRPRGPDGQARAARHPGSRGR